MATTNTTTGTATFARLVLIRNQFRTAFQRILGYSDKEAAPYLDWISKKKIVKISFRGYTLTKSNEKEIWCELVMHVDWEKHNAYMIKGVSQIEIKKSFNGMIPEIDGAIRWMEEMVQIYNLKTMFTIYYGNVPPEEKKAFSKAQKLGPISETKWRSNPITIATSYGKELPELTAAMKVCE